MSTITFAFYNKYTGTSLGGATIPYDRTKAHTGAYSGLWKKFRPLLASTHGLDKHWVRAKVTRGNAPVEYTIALSGHERFVVMNAEGMEMLAGVIGASRNQTA